MASDSGSAGQDDDGDEDAPKVEKNGKLEEDSDQEEDDEEEEEEEPRLEYTSMTKKLAPVYRNADATSAFLVAGDKMIIGTHNGNIHVLSLPSMQSLRVYHAHSASISALSISPFPPPLPASKADAVSRITTEHRNSPATSAASLKAQQQSPRGSPKQPPVPLTPSNAIHIASSSIDGNVCVASLTDTKDVMLRNFGRPVQAVSLSPDYKNDRSYLSGGTAGSLILTVGGRSGTSSTSNTTGGAAAQASGWLGSIGLGSNTGKDTVLHSGEGAIRIIRWSLSGKYVIWVNEKGIKIMRSNLHLESAETDFAWKRMSHIDHPNYPGWEDMAGVWKPHVEWIDEAGLESENDYDESANGSMGNPASGVPPAMQTPKSKLQSGRTEKMVVGWGGTIWIVDVHPGGPGTGKEAGERRIGRVEVVNILRTDCIISGISLYTQNLLIVLAYVTPEEKGSPIPKTAKRGVHRRQNALQPEMRIIDLTTKEEVCGADTLNVSRYESLSATDYHLGVLPAIRVANKAGNTRGTLEAIGGGIWDATMYTWDATMYPTRAIGGGIWDATMQTTRLFSGAMHRNPSVQSSKGSGSKVPSDSVSATDVSAVSKENMPNPATLTHGMKIFIQSPYDCVLATKPTITDHLAWLDSHAKYEEAWNLLDRHPEAVGNTAESSVGTSAPSTPTKGLLGRRDPMASQASLEDFFADDSSQTTISGPRDFNSQAQKEKRRIGEQWVQQLIKAEDWVKAGRVCGQVLGTSSSWEHWVWVFAQANKYEEITDYIPTTQLRPPLPSLVYEMILGNYVSKDRLRLKALLERWPTELFDASSIISAIQGRLKGRDISESSAEDGIVGRDWRILMQSLAKLYIADGRPRQALSCYIRLQDADAAMSLVNEQHLVDAISDDIPGFILLRVSKEQQRSAPLSQLESATLEAIHLLVDEAHHGIVPPEIVIEQLDNKTGMQPYLFFYFRALWNGDTTLSTSDARPQRRPTSPMLTSHLAATEGKTLVSDHADLAVRLFAEYDRPLLMNFLRSSQSYTLEIASKICEQRNYIPELVYLLSKEGRTAHALRLIIDQIGDVSQAIAFAKEQDDAGLWDDLLDYSMNKPSFIRGLLEEVGTSIDPIKLVRRIPEGLEIEGLKQGLQRMMKEYEIQYSISEGVARVLRGEVGMAMGERGRGQKRGVRFEVDRKAVAHGKSHVSQTSEKGGEGKKGERAHHSSKIKPGHCPGCGKAFFEDDPILLSHPCTHTFHLPCLLSYNLPPSSPAPEIPSSLATLSATDYERFEYDRSVGAKVDRVRLIRTLLDARRMRGCPVLGCGGDDGG